MVTHARAMLLAICMLFAVADTCGAARALTRGELAPLLGKKVVIAKAPEPTPWPEEFTIAFTTDDGTASGELFYDWGNKQQVILHGEGSSHCKARGSTGACYILENSGGTFEVDPVARKCEITSEWGTVPPTWVVPGVFGGVEDVNGVKCNRFNYPPSPHTWLETVDGGEFCAFGFPAPSFTYIFSPSSLKLEKPASKIFTIPDYCPKDTTSVDLQEAHLKAIL
ncbi:hypothetical protein KC19_12G095100 [Ceratodon purpureus]|uniref:Uncharacterized protein n=1 Tax=Ceratodon purpureus TaxID=3225 RepID=A0A8T0G5D8_CERPU|nr:hypothetical protein KC19_12G095100 [Ceratodon purpureus]KAG0554484.1 hypothetical protein KC19_12G095100 [Ceratodon purpureus]